MNTEKFNIASDIKNLLEGFNEISTNFKNPQLISICIEKNEEDEQDNPKIKKLTVRQAERPIRTYKIGKKTYVDINSIFVRDNEDITVNRTEIEQQEKFIKFKNIIDKVVKIWYKIKDILKNVNEFLQELHIYISYNPETKEIIIFYENNENLFPVWLKFKLNLSGILLLFNK